MSAISSLIRLGRIRLCGDLPGEPRYRRIFISSTTCSLFDCTARQFGQSTRFAKFVTGVGLASGSTFFVLRR